MSDKPTLVWIPGHMCDERLWRDVGPVAGFRNFYADITGHDTIGALALDVLSQVDGPIIPIGFSMGAIVALMMAKLAPDRAVAMVLASTNCTADLPERSAVRIAQQASVRAGHLDAVVSEELKPHYLSPATQGDRRQDILGLTFAMGMDLGADVFIRQSEALRTRPGLCDVIDTFEALILIIAGTDDTLCPPAWHQKMAARARQATYNEIPQAGHLTPLETPIPFSQAIMKWLGTQ